ncbi:hypothetical protein [Candidatus Uabimicrobium sp. HlEnr_7]|uniref:hypothetical protein n=1 Tax=Candidatus Uabimicrobium helgolandensis TaxID=3095367 RepID=UPI003555ED46
MVDYTQNFKNQNNNLEKEQQSSIKEKNLVNENTNEEYEQIIREHEIEWKIKSKIWFYFELLLFRIPYLAAYLCIVVFMGAFLDCYELIFIIALTLVVTANMRLLTYMMNNHTILDSIPLIGHSLKILRKLYIFYYAHKPPVFLYYMFFIPFGFIATIFSFRAREEFKLYCQMVYSFAVLFILKVVIFYFAIFPPYLSGEDAFTFVFVQIFMTTLVIFAFASPVISTAFVLHFTKHRGILKFINGGLLILLIILTMAALDLADEEYSASFLAEQTLKMRLEKSQFCKDLTQKTQGFFRSDLPKTDAIGLMFTDLKLTKLYREAIKGMLATNEDRAFSTILIGEEENIWILICCRLESKAYLLYACNNERNIYTSWKLLPENIRKKFSLNRINNSPSFPSEISHFSLMAESPLRKD